MGFEGGAGPFWEKLWDDNVEEVNIYDHIPPDDPFAPDSIMKNIAKAMKTKFDDKIWETDEVKPEETPEEFKESGAITVNLKDEKIALARIELAEVST